MGSSLLKLMLVFVLLSGIIKLAWDPNIETDLAGYKIYYGVASRTYTTVINVGNVTTYSVHGLDQGVTYFFAATAYDTSNNESGYSNEVSGLPQKDGVDGLQIK